jgi:cyanophycin synthetase
MHTHQLNASSRILHETALKMGIECTVFNDHETILMKKDGSSWYTRGSRNSYQSSVGKSIADNKPLTKEILTHFGIPTAPYVVLRSEADLEKLSSLKFPIVAKPLAGRQGSGVVVGLKNSEEIQKHITKTGYPLLCENLLHGVEYRIICVNFKFIAAAFRKPAHVVGDGVNTILQLIEEKNKHPWRGKDHVNNLSMIEVDEEMKSRLGEIGYTFDSIPTQGEEIVLKKTANLSTGGEAWDVTDQVSAENKVLFEKIARICDLNVIGIDIMCNDLQTPLIEQPDAGVIEVNASPGLRMHHFPIQGQPRNIAQASLEMILEKNQKSPPTNII